MTLAYTLPIKVKGGKEYGRRFFQFNRKTLVSICEDLAANLHIPQNMVAQGDLHLLDPAVSLIF